MIPVLCSRCWRRAKFNVAMLVWYCPICNMSITAEEVYEGMNKR